MDKLKRFQVIGTVGLTGLTVAPHLHFEIRKDGTPINPIHFLLPAYDKMEEIEIGTSRKEPELKASEFFILEFIKTKKMVSNEFYGISNMTIEVLGKKNYLLVKGANSLNNYAFELVKSKRKLFLTSYNPSHFSRSLEEGLDAFKIETGEIVGGNEDNN